MTSDTDRAGLAADNVTACFPDMDAARRAVEALEHAGVAASAISLLGPQAERAAQVTDTAGADERIMDESLRATVGGAAAGTGVGGAVGFLAGAAAFGIPGVGPAVGAGIWASTLAGAAAGGGVGFTAGAMAKLKQSRAWELTLQQVGDGHVVVGVHTDDPQEFADAVDALRGRAPRSLHRFDADGNEVAI